MPRNMNPSLPHDYSVRGIDFDDEEFGFQEEDKSHIKVHSYHVESHSSADLDSVKK